MNYVLKSFLTVLVLSLSVTGAAADKKKSKTKTKIHAHAHVKAKAKAKAKAVPAKILFGKMTTAAFVPAKAYGSYAKGCFAGGKKLATDALNWQVMRPSRNRNWGHPRILAYIDQLAKDAKAYDGWPGLLVGDMSQPRGGPVPGHASHQMGLDADIWLLPAPERRYSLAEREKISAISVLTKDKKQINAKTWRPEHLKLLRRVVSYKSVNRIFVNPVIKKRLCRDAGKDRGWLRKVRPWRGHYAHFHVRLNCPNGNRGCKTQPAPGVGDGCGADLAKWFKPPPKKKKGYKFKFVPKPEITLANLPRACARVLKQ